MIKGFRTVTTILAASAITLLSTSSPAAAQGQFLPYYQPPVVKGGPVPRLPDGKPDMQGYYGPRFNQSIFEIENHPVAHRGIAAGKGSIVDPPNGMIPYKPDAAAKAKDLGDNHVYDEPEAHCFMSGVPHSAYQQFGFQVIQPPGYFLILFEYAHSFRVIPTDGRPHIPKDIRLFMGDSVGHWEGDTLVIDTTNQNGRTWFDMVGNFTTPNIHVVERITPVDSNNVNYEAAIEDSTIYTQPWKIAGNWGRRPDDKEYQQMEFACIEGNQDLEHYTEGVGGAAKQRR
jgi:hypothetical protein